MPKISLGLSGRDGCPKYFSLPNGSGKFGKKFLKEKLKNPQWPSNRGRREENGTSYPFAR